MKNTHEKPSYEKNLFMNNNTKWSKLSMGTFDNNLQTKEYPGKLSKRLLQGAKNIVFKTGSVFKRANDFIEEKSKKVEQEYLGDFLSSYVESKKLAAMTMLGIGLVFGSGVGKANAGGGYLGQSIGKMNAQELFQYNFNASAVQYMKIPKEERKESFKEYMDKGGMMTHPKGPAKLKEDEPERQTTQTSYKIQTSQKKAEPEMFAFSREGWVDLNGDGLIEDNEITDAYRKYFNPENHIIFDVEFGYKKGISTHQFIIVNKDKNKIVYEEPALSG